VDKLSARLLATAALWVRIQTSLKNTKMGDITKGVTNTHNIKKQVNTPQYVCSTIKYIPTYDNADGYLVGHSVDVLCELPLDGEVGDGVRVAVRQLHRSNKLLHCLHYSKFPFTKDISSGKIKCHGFEITFTEYNRYGILQL
jgi:hypothetical protein